MLEDEDEREEVDESSHAERPLAIFLRPPLLPPGLWSTAPVVGPKLPPRRRLQPHQHPMRLPRVHHAVTAAAVVVVATPTICAATLTIAVPVVVTVPASQFPPVSFCQFFLWGSAKRNGWGPCRGLSAGPYRGQGSGRLLSVRHRAYNPRESRRLPLKGRPLAATPTSLTRGRRRPFPPPRSPTLRRSLPSVQTPYTRRCPKEGVVPAS